MSAFIEPDQMRAMRATLSRNGEQAPSLHERWATLHESAGQIAAMASLAQEAPSPEMSSFPRRLEARGGVAMDLANDALSDIDAMLQPGLTALRTIAARGQDTTAPAQALWREFHSARQAVLALCPAEGNKAA